MDAPGNRHQMGAVLCIEVVQIRLMLEIVGIALAVLNDVVGNDVVVVLLNIQRDALFGQDVLADLQNLAVRSRSSSAADGLAVQCIVVDRGVIAVAGSPAKRTLTAPLCGFSSMKSFTLWLCRAAARALIFGSS